MHYIPKHFSSFEVVPNDIWALNGDYSFYWIDSRILWTLDSLRDYFNVKITVNNWHIGGPYSQRGFRNDINIGAKYSAHRYGNAVDFDITGITSEEFRAMIKAGKLSEQLKYITRCEENVEWIHLDCMGLPREVGQSIEFFTA